MLNPLIFTIMKHENGVSLKDFVKLCSYLSTIYYVSYGSDGHTTRCYPLFNMILEFESNRVRRDDLFVFAYTRLKRYYRDFHINNAGILHVLNLYPVKYKYLNLPEYENA